MTTSLAYEELLAFEGLQDAVDQLYRAYLDSTLVEAKRAHKSNPKGYWENVREFRESELDPGTQPQYPEKAKLRIQTVQADNQLDTERKKKAELRQFLYWFDVRAKFWWNEADTSFALEEFPYAEELLLLNAQATALKARLERLKKIYENRAKGAGQPALESNVLDKLKRQVDSAARYTALIERVMSAHVAQQAQTKKKV